MGPRESHSPITSLPGSQVVGLMHPATPANESEIGPLGAPVGDRSEGLVAGWETAWIDLGGEA